MAGMQTVADRPEVSLSAPAPSRATQVVDTVRRRWAGMAGRLGLGMAALGFLVILLGWNGAAGLDYVSGQVPYLISGAAAGLGLVVLGASLLLAESNRRDRAVLQQHLEELNSTIARLAAATSAVAGNGHAPTTSGAGAGGRRRPQAAGAQLVVAGRTSFHDPACHLVESRSDWVRMSRDDAEAEGLTPCRVCTP
jgi:hypothetical protein